MKLTPEQLEQRRETRERNKNRKAVQALAHAVIASGYAQQARILHPDVGGSHEAMTHLGDVCQCLHKAVDDGYLSFAKILPIPLTVQLIQQRVSTLKVWRQWR